MSEAGWISVVHQFFAYPCYGNLHFTDQRDLAFNQATPKSPGSLLSAHSQINNKPAEISAYLRRNEGKYLQFLRQKSRNPSPDIYACFQPFNECFKALFPFIDYIKKQLKPGDRVLNLWDRSGWTASMLGGWFPDQEIVTVWEGDKDILGYKGFHYWMHPDRRTQHSVVFADFLRPLPFEDKSFAAVVGMDLLHRFNQPELMAEINRVATGEAPILFPHVHLTNNEPDPFFDRGCRQLHGNEYDAVFSQLQSFTGRKGYVCSEPGLFEWNDRSPDRDRLLVSEPGHNDYNGCIAWLPVTHIPKLVPWRGHASNWDEGFLLQNCFLEIDPVSNQIAFNVTLYGDLIGELLGQHSVYARRIAPAIGFSADEKWCEILYWARQGLRLKDIMKKTGLGRDEMQQHLDRLFAVELAQVVPVDEAGFRLQTLLGTQRYLGEKKEDNLARHWARAVSLHAEEPWLCSGDSTLRYSDGDELITLLRTALAGEGLQRGDHLILSGQLSAEQLLLFWAAVQLGIVVMPVSAHESPQRLLGYIHETGAKMIFAEPEMCEALNSSGIRRIMFDITDHPLYRHSASFDAWLSASGGEEHSRNVPVPDPGPEDIAVLLWTTGSTGNPKAVALTHSQLIRSGRAMTETYGWKKTDKYYALGGLGFMSGLRQATVCLAETGASAIIPEAGMSIHRHLAEIGRSGASIITANPAFYRTLIQAFGLQDNQRLLKTLRLTLCTGNALPADLKTDWQRISGLPLYNYYGLTETSGICIAELPGAVSGNENNIGVPVDCLMRIVDEKNKRVTTGQTGELQVYGAGVFGGYYHNGAATAKTFVEGWFCTKDLALQNPDGSIELKGRISDTVKLPSGERISLTAIEEMLDRLPDIADYALCPRIQDERESIALFIVPAPGVTDREMIAKIKNLLHAELGAFAVPAFIDLVNEIPRGNHNKVLRNRLLDRIT